MKSLGVDGWTVIWIFLIMWTWWQTSVQLPHLGDLVDHIRQSVDPWEYCAHTSMQYRDVETRLLQRRSYMARHFKYVALLQQCPEHVSLGWCYKNRSLFMRTPLLKSLHWLPVHHAAIRYKLVLMTYKAKVSKTPRLSPQVVIRSNYLFINVIEVCHQEHYCVQSSPGSNYGDRACQCFGDPSNVGMSYLLILIFPTISIFSKSDWKTFLFNCAYNWLFWGRKWSIKCLCIFGNFMTCKIRCVLPIIMSLCKP